MFKTTFIVLLSLFTLSVAAKESSILGKWKDKSNPSTYKYEFKKNQDFIYTYIWKAKKEESKGVWDIGSWTATKGEIKRSCNLTIYADTNECCFGFKFIANNLILTNEYSKDNFDSMCENRVLIKDK